MILGIISTMQYPTAITHPSFYSSLKQWSDERRIGVRTKFDSSNCPPLDDFHVNHR